MKVAIRLSLAVLLLAAWLSVLGFPERAGALARHDQTTLWTTNGLSQPGNTAVIKIPVCWATQGWAAEKRLVTTGVLRTWQRVALVRFTHWTACPETGTERFVKVAIDLATDDQGGGVTIGSGKGTLRLPSEPFSVGLSLRPGMSPDRIRYIGIHEFGHVLGFIHEDDSPARHAGCASLPTWTNVIQITPWDLRSIMNSACNVLGNNVGYLSPLDRIGARRTYGERFVKNLGDFDGDSLPDLGIWRTGTWYVIGRENILWGEPGDKVVPADYNGDGRTDPAVWRPATGTWYIADNESPPLRWGQQGDVPVPADYNGDGRVDLAVWRPSSGVWFINDGVHVPVVWGESGDIPVPGDYDGDGRAERAVWRPSLGYWFVDRGNGVYDRRWGEAGDIPVPGDFAGEGKVRPTVWRPSTGEWWFSSPSVLHGDKLVLGHQGDVPLAVSVTGNGIDEPVIWTPNSGSFIYLVSTIWGQPGDVVVP